MKKFMLTVTIIMIITGTAFAFENSDPITKVEPIQPTPIVNENTIKEEKYEKLIDGIFNNIANIFQRVFLLFDHAEEEYKVNQNKE